MKKTFNINLSGLQFVIDEDAYDMLSQYLETISHAYSTPEEGKELEADIESRIAELFADSIGDTRAIITIKMVEDVISRIGTPGQFLDIEIIDRPDSESATIESVATPPPYFEDEKVRKRLYRDPNDKLLGGVCAGLAAYLNIDPTWVRLVTAALCFLSIATVAIVYLILWIILPEANTPLERMQMKGERPTFKNIGQTVTGYFNSNNYNTVSPRSGGKRLADIISKVIGLIARCFVVVLIFMAIPILFAVVVTLILCVVAAACYGISEYSRFIPGPFIHDNGYLVITILTTLTFVIGIPLFVVIYNLFSHDKSLSRAMRNTLIILWSVAFAVLSACSIVTFPRRCNIGSCDSAECATLVTETVTDTDSTFAVKSETNRVSSTDSTQVKEPVVQHTTSNVSKKEKSSNKS